MAVSTAKPVVDFHYQVSPSRAHEKSGSARLATYKLNRNAETP